MLHVQYCVTKMCLPHTHLIQLEDRINPNEIDKFISTKLPTSSLLCLKLSQKICIMIAVGKSPGMHGNIYCKNYQRDFVEETQSPMAIPFTEEIPKIEDFPSS